MITIRPAAQRGHTDFGWLDSWHTFSFGGYQDPRHMGFGPLRVINDDRVAPGQGFGMHGHRDMEIISLVLAGALEHRDNLGHGAVLRPGEVQRMSAGTGIRHSEFNPSPAEPVHFLQIWIEPDRPGHEPDYDQKPLATNVQPGEARLLASPDGRDGSVRIHQDATLRLIRLAPGKSVTLSLQANRRAWVHVVAGQVTVNGTTLGEADGAAIDGEAAVDLAAVNPGSQLLYFDLP